MRTAELQSTEWGQVRGGRVRGIRPEAHTHGGGLTGIEEEAEAIDDCTKWSK